MKNTLIKYILPLLFLCLCGCDYKIAKIDNPLENQNGNFILYVSNQSYEIKSVDILVAIDDKPIVHEYFKVGNQHNWKQFTLQMQSGKHMIEAITQKGNATVSQQFEVNEKHWAVLDFCYGKKEGHACNKPSLKFEVSDRPIGFM